MEATLRAKCPECQTALRIPAKWLGQTVKCKNCGARVRTKAKPQAAATDGAAPTPPLASVPVPVPVPQPVSFDFNQPSNDEADFFGPSEVPPAAPSPPALDANGYPIPTGYAAPLPAGYPYGTPGYPYPAPAAHPAPVPMPPGAYPAAPGYAVPAAYPQPYPVPAARPVMSPGPQAYAPADAMSSGVLSVKNPVSAATAAYSGRGKYRRGGSGKFIWIGFFFLLTAGLVTAGIIYIPGMLTPETAANQEPDPTQEKQDPTPPTATPNPANSAFPRRLLFISITKYMYLNPLTASREGIDLTKPAALRLAYDWRIPNDKDNNQIYLLSDTVMGNDTRLPMKNVVQGTYQQFFNTSRAQDRIVIYFGGHAIEKNGKAYLAPMEAEIEGEDWEKSLIPLEHFYSELKKCGATQKLVIWDVCRFNPERGRERPGSEPMTEALYKALTSPPPGIQVVTTCKPGENAMEFNALRPDGFRGAVYGGSSFLESMKFVAEPRNNRLPRTMPTQADPFPVNEWAQAIARRAVEMSELAEKSGSAGQQTVSVVGTAPENLTPPNPAEQVAARFEFPLAPKGASLAEIAAVEREFFLPPLKPGLSSIALADFPFPADVMSAYADDGVSFDTILKDKEKYPLRAAVIEALEEIRKRWTPGAGTTNLRTSIEGPINDAKKASIRQEQEFWAIGIVMLEQHLDVLARMAPLRESESKRWQAHYDFALASLQARLAYMNEYNKVLGLLITESLPVLDEKLGHDGYTLVASESLRSGREIKKLADDAQELFKLITARYKGTPWAIQAKQEKSVVIGLNWKPASLKNLN